MNYQSIIDAHYPADSRAREIYMEHCTDVAALAREIAAQRKLAIDLEELKAAAMLHDIGIFLTDAPSIDCHGTKPYLMHGYLGAKLLRDSGAPESWARVAERHTGAGITRDEIEASGLPMPPGDYLPETLLERLVCYADKFYSKSGKMERKPLEKVRKSIDKYGPAARQRFEKLHAEFGQP